MIVLVCLALGPLTEMLVFSVFYKVAGHFRSHFPINGSVAVLIVWGMGHYFCFVRLEPEFYYV
mgnify:CR=1 FL=1